MRRVTLAVLARLWVPALVLVLWQLWVIAFHVPDLVMPGPIAVLQDLAANPGLYLDLAWSTIRVAAIGLVLGMVFGLGLAVAGWSSPFFSGLVSPGAMMLRTIPITAMIPIIARLFGYSSNTVIAVAVLISIFPAFVFASAGLRTVPGGANDYFEVMRAGKMARLRRLALPAAIPNLMTAFRISAGLCILGALIAEWLIGADGLGHQLALARIEFRVEEQWGVALVAAVLSVAAFLGATALERRAIERWT